MPVSVNKGMENGEVSLDGDRDCHEDAGAEKDVVERVEEVGEKEMVDKGNLTRYWAWIGCVLLKGRPCALCDA